jgi:hypothetical protein
MNDFPAAPNDREAINENCRTVIHYGYLYRNTGVGNRGPVQHVPSECS